LYVQIILIYNKFWLTVMTFSVDLGVHWHYNTNINNCWFPSRAATHSLTVVACLRMLVQMLELCSIALLMNLLL